MRPVLVAVITLALAVSCASRGTLPRLSPVQNEIKTTASTAAIDWPTWGFDRARTGYNPSESTLAVSSVSALVLKWSAHVSSAYIDTQPIVLGALQRVYVGDEAGKLFAIDSLTGATSWASQLGETTASGCSGNLAASSTGITGSPVYDASADRLYVLDGLGVLRAMDPATGTQSPGFAPLTVFTQPKFNHSWSALQLRADGSALYFTTASHCDAGTYYGVVGRVNTSTQHIRRFMTVTNTSTYYGNGVWGWGSPSIDPDNGHLYAGIGNSMGSSGESGLYSDSVLELTGFLSYAADEEPETANLSGDLDIGSTPVVFDYAGSKCVAFTRKDGVLFTVKRGALRNDSFASKISLGANIATPAYDPVTHSLYLTAANGLAKVTVGAGCSASTAWESATGGSSYQTPVAANGVIYVAGGSKLFAIDANTGRMLWNSGTSIGGAVIAAPTVVNGAVYAAARDGAVYKFAL